MYAITSDVRSLLPVHPAAIVRRSTTAALLLALGLVLPTGATLPSPAPAIVDRAVMTRQVEGALDVVLVRSDGTERLLRHLTAEGLGFAPGSAIWPGASLGLHGWLELHVSSPAPDRTGPAPYGHDVLVDLADAGRAPIVFAANGFMSGVFGPDGRYAHYDLIRTSPVRTGKGGPVRGGPISGGAVTVIDPEAGEASAIGVPSVQTFGGGPVIIWAADGSGFLARQDGGWGVTSIATGTVVPGVPVLSAGWLGIWRSGTREPGFGLGVDPWGAGDLLEAMPLAALPSADGMGLWELLIGLEVAPSRAVLARLTGPGRVGSVHTFDLPAGHVVRFRLSLDEAFVAFDLGTPDGTIIALAPVGPGDERLRTGPGIAGDLAGLVSGAEADAWPGP